MLPEAALGVVFGEPGSGKSFMVLDLVAAIARGVPWRDRKVKQRKAVYVAAEGAGGFRNRVAAYMRQFDVNFGDQLLIISRPPNLLDGGDATALTHEIRNVEAGVVVIDTLSQALAGADENTSTDMGKALKACRDLHIATGAMVILVHHSGKDISRGARGWSGLKAAADVEIEVTRNVEARVARVSKLKDGEDGLAFGFRLLPILLGHDEDGDEISSCVVGLSDVVQLSAPVLGANQRITLNALQSLVPLSGDPVTAEAVIVSAAEAMPEPEKPGRDRRRDRAGEALRGLIERGTVVEVEGGLLPADMCHRGGEQ